MAARLPKQVKSVMRALAIAVLMVSVLTSSLARGSEVVFGVIATDSASIQRQRWEPLFRDMERKTGLTIRSYFAPDYAGVVEAMRFGKVHVAWLGNKAAIEAVDRSQAEVFAQVVYADGSLGYNSLLLARQDSPYQNEADVLRHAAQIHLGLGDPSSTSGFLVPVYYLFTKNGIDHRVAFKSVRNASHGANIQAVLARQVDVAIANTEDYGKLVETKPALARQLRVLWRSPLIPSDPLVWRRDLDPAVKASVRQFLLNYAKQDPLEKSIMQGIYNYGGFRASSDAQLLPIRELERARDRERSTVQRAGAT